MEICSEFSALPALFNEYSVDRIVLGGTTDIEAL
jgi:hypothetical protein